MSLNCRQIIHEQWNATETYLLQSASTAFDYLLKALDLQSEDSIICDPLVPPLWLAELQKRKIQVLFIDLQTVNGNLDLELLEDFLSLSTLINEKDELIYRKNQLPIKAIFSHTKWENPIDLNRFLFIAKRYYLKVVAHTAVNDLLNPTLRSAYGGDLIQGGIQIQEQKVEVLIVNQAIKAIPLMIGANRSLKKISIPEDQQIKLERGLPTPAISTFKIKAIEGGGSIRLVNFYPSFAQIFTPDKNHLQTLLTTKGFVCVDPFSNRDEALQAYTFLSRNKVAIQYLDQVLWVSVPDLAAQNLLLKILQQ